MATSIAPVMGVRQPVTVLTPITSTKVNCAGEFGNPAGGLLWA